MLLLPLALAHSPHDMVRVVSVAEDGTMLTADEDSLVWSTDSGAHLGFQGLSFGVPTCALPMSATEWVVVIPESGVWYTSHAGEHWAVVGGPTDATRCLRSGDRLYIADGDTLWGSDTGFEWAALGPPTDAPILDVAVDGGGVSVLVEGGSVARLVDDTWSVVATGPYQAIAAGDGDLLLAASVGPLHLLDAQGTSVLTDGPEGVRSVAVGGGVWLATTATEAVWVSTDRGATWTLRSDGIEELAVGSGGAPDDIHYFEMVATPDRWWLAAWEGLFTRAPEDTHWRQLSVRALPRVTWGEQLSDGSVLIGTVGGGVYRGEPGTSEWEDVSEGIPWVWIRQAVIADDGSELGKWFVDAGNVVYISEDAGETWDVPYSGMPIGGYAVAVSPDFAVDQRALFGGQFEDESSAMAWSADGGDTWTPVILPGTCGLKPDEAVMTRSYSWATCSTRLFRSEDQGESWVRHADLGARPSGLLPLTDDHLLVPTSGGVFEVVGAEEPVLVGYEGKVVEAMTVGADGAWYVSVQGEGLSIRDPDGTERPLAWRATDAVDSLVVTAEGRILVGSRLGLFASDDGGATFALACPWDRYDDVDQSWWWKGWEVAEEATAKAAAVRVGGRGAVAEWWVDGEAVALWGGAERATVTVDIDGEAEHIEIDDVPVSTRLYGRNLQPGVHLVTVTVHEGTLFLDGGERWREGAPVFEVPGVVTDEPGCGCGGGSALILGLLPTAFRRRRRG